jgi:hypothetical protein
MRKATLDIGSNMPCKLYAYSSSYGRKHHTTKNNIVMIKEKKL